MPIERLDHYSVRTRDLVGAVHFYAAVLGFVCGPRPVFPFSGAWLYRMDDQSNPVGGSLVHLIATGDKDETGLTGFLGEKSAHSVQGTGPMDHIAFHATDIAAMYQTLNLCQIPFRERRVVGLPLHLLFIEDPSGVTIELNYTSPSDIAAADARSLTV
jgi:catechol 2,3-dioxygenase-like lactoylglutathione lyase family enzyme